MCLQDIRNRDRPGHALYSQAIEAIKNSPNIPNGLFPEERLPQTAANLAVASVAAAARPQGGQSERLDRIDFVVFNTQRDGLIACQGELGNPSAKLAFLPAAQDNATGLKVASEQLHDTLQRSQAKGLDTARELAEVAKQQSAPGSGARGV